MRINAITSPVGNLTSFKNAPQNTAFKGVYLVNGTNAEVNRVIKYLKHAKQDDTQISYDKISKDAYSDTLLSYVLVTSGKDMAIYNDFVKKNEDLYKKSSVPALDEPVSEDFETDKDFENHKRASETLDVLEKIFSGCKFTKPAHNVSAKKALPAMKEGKFDYKEGEIKA